MKITFNNKYNRNDWIKFFKENFLPEDYDYLPEQVNTEFKSKYIDKKVVYLGVSKSLNLKVYEMHHNSENDPRIGLSRDAFKFIDHQKVKNALILFISKNSDNYRFSLITREIKLEGKKAKTEFTNPKRFSYFVGPDAKTHTIEQYLVKKGRIKDEKDLKERFSVEVVNKEFYDRIAKLFTELVGGLRKIGNQNQTFEALLKLPDTNNHSAMQEFAVRLIGRIVFCWFLKKKKSKNGNSLIPEKVLSVIAVKHNYYHNILELLFFEVMNTPIDERNDLIKNNELFKNIPFLNGGLFDPELHEDYYNYSVSQKKYQQSYNLKIPDKWFVKFFKVLELYNFTINENTSIDVDLSVDPEMLGRIFENLLAEINPETQQTAQKSTGSFYTPRPIVEYMVDESLVQYLVTKTSGIGESKIRNLLDYSTEKSELSKEKNSEVADALDEIKIIDPACGSGAFPMGILQKMLLIRQKIDPQSIEWVTKQLDKIPDLLVRSSFEEKLMNENWDYRYKMSAILHSIYGVDIQPIAVEISKLRFFLTLMVDETINDEKENRGINSLPNLSFKFVSANTLIGLPENKQAINALEFNTIFDPMIEKLEKIREKYFYSSGNKKLETENEFKDVQNEIGKTIAKKEGSKNKKALALSLWKPFSDESSDWFDPKWMFGVENGFDIVIGNPPYIGEKGNKETFVPLKNSSLGKRFYQGKMDIFYFFFHLGLDLLKNDGINAYITTNYYITATGAKNLRNDCKDRASLLKLLNFGEFKIFESASGQHNMITILQKGYNPQKEIWAAKVGRKGFLKNNNEVIQNVLSGIDSKTEYYEQTNKTVYYEDDNYIGFWPKEYSNIFLKMEKFSVSIGNVCVVNNGIHTQADYLTRKKFNERSNKNKSIGDGIYILSKNSFEDAKVKSSFNKYELSNHIKPFFKNSDVRNYITNISTEKEIIYLDKQKHNIEKLPNIKKHLLDFDKLIDKASDNAPYLHRPKKIHFESPKIVVPQRSRTNTFGYNEIPWYAASDVFFITQPKKNYLLKYILGVLNSKLIYKWLYYRGKRKGENLELTATPLKEIPIAKATEDQQNVIVEIVDKIIQKKKDKENTTHFENQIDLMVYKLYELTYEEVKIVDPDFLMSEEEYENE